VKAVLEDGRTIDLGHKHIVIKGENGDSLNELDVVLDSVIGHAVGSILLCDMTIVKDGTGNRIDKGD
jgi:hypothetical protein